MTSAMHAGLNAPSAEVPAALPVPYSIKRHGVSLANCDDEPVQTPGCIQAHGLLLALRLPDLVVRQVSENCQRWTSLTVDQLLGRNLAQLLGEAALQRIQALLATEALEGKPCYALRARLLHAPEGQDAMDITLHTAEGVLLLELEPGAPGSTAAGHDGDYFLMVKKTVGRLKAAPTMAAFCDVVASEARTITGLDRAMVYRFAADDSGEVMADAHRADLPSWQGLRYPAGDIPRPAREIFKKIGVRPLPDAQGALCEMVPLRNPDTGRPLLMTHCALRGASVMYTEYLQNMGVAASLTMPILRDGALWGLIACHHDTPLAMPHALRAAAEFLGQIASLEIAQAELREDQQYRSLLDAVHLAVLAGSADDGQLQLTPSAGPALLDGIHADGVAAFQRGRWLTAGTTPDEPMLKPLAAWLRGRLEQASDGLQTVAVDALGAEYPPAQAWASVASGVLATALSRHADSPLILWFRGEQVQTYNWAGNPHEKPVVVGAQGPRLTPRRSFDLWQEQVRGRSQPWKRVELEAAQKLRRMVMELVVVRAERLAEANAELARSNAELDDFAYVVGHDLKEPLRGINQYAQQLLQEAQDSRVADTGRLAWLLRLTVRMDTLLDALLHYSRVGRLQLDFTHTDLGVVLVEALEMLGPRVTEGKVEVRVPRPLPALRCDRARVREILSNLISNAAKYSNKTLAWVEVGYIAAPGGPACRARPASAPVATANDTVFYVADNGIGIEDRHQARIFDIFKRLHPQDDYGGGSGVGLTIARKMVEQHHGRLWVDSQPGVGSTFYFTLPANAASPANAAPPVAHERRQA